MDGVAKTFEWCARDRQSFPEDDLLRWDDAFRIQSRPAKGEPIWTHVLKGTTHTQTDAIGAVLRQYGCKPKNGKWKLLGELYTRDEAVRFVLATYKRGRHE